MTFITPRQFCKITFLLGGAFFTGLHLTPAQQQTPPPKTAEQQFKNIQALKDIPADQLIPTMQFIAGALGVDCEFCHVEHAGQGRQKRKADRAQND